MDIGVIEMYLYSLGLAVCYSVLVIGTAFGIAKFAFWLLECLREKWEERNKEGDEV